MYNHIFLDANIILDIFDNTRKQHQYSATAYLTILEQGSNLYTSCDIITTLYYVYAKKNKAEALDKIQKIAQTLEIIAFSNQEVNKTCAIMKKDEDYNDLEDTIQYILAKRMACDLIISNDAGFVAKDIKLVSSKAFCALMR